MKAFLSNLINLIKRLFGKKKNPFIEAPGMTKVGDGVSMRILSDDEVKSIKNTGGLIFHKDSFSFQDVELQLPITEKFRPKEPINLFSEVFKPRHPLQPQFELWYQMQVKREINELERIMNAT